MRRALVLPGGGAKGSWQVGACEHLIVEKGHWYDVISGVSAGAINGATLAHGHDPAGLRAHTIRLRNWWFGVRGSDDIYRRRRFGALGMALGKWRGLYDVTPLRDEVLRQEIDPEQVAASPIRLRVGYVDLRSGRFRAAGNDHPRLRDALLASSSLPFLFPPTELAETRELGVDGGMRHAALLADTLQTLMQLGPRGEPLDVWVVRPRPGNGLAPKATVRRWLKKAVAALPRDPAATPGPGKPAADSRGVVLPCRGRSRPGWPWPLPPLRLRVVQPPRELPGSFLDFNPARIRAWYQDGLHTAKAPPSVDLHYPDETFDQGT